jgi:glycosyltransferase involved in cell wall biosynthesis
MGDPLVSIMIPSFNQAAYIDEAIASVLAQDYEPLEVVVSDDGSTDGTAERVRAWAAREPHRVVALTGAHIGMPANWNRGLGACRGRYVALQGGDDVFLPGKVRRQVEWFESNPARVMSGHVVDAFDSDTGRQLYLGGDHLSRAEGRGARRFVERLQAFPSNSLMVRAAAIPAQRFDERIAAVCDFKFQVDVLAGGGTYGFLSDLLSRYRVHAGSISQQSLRSTQVHRQYFDGFDRSLALIEEADPSLAAACRTARARLLFGEARWRQQRGDVTVARVYFRAAIRHSPIRLGLRGVLGLAMTGVSRAAQDRADRALAAAKARWRVRRRQSSR